MDDNLPKVVKIEDDYIDTPTASPTLPGNEKRKSTSSEVSSSRFCRGPILRIFSTNSKNRSARTVPLHRRLDQLFTSRPDISTSSDSAPGSGAEGKHLASRKNTGGAVRARERRRGRQTVSEKRKQSSAEDEQHSSTSSGELNNQSGDDQSGDEEQNERRKAHELNTLPLGGKTTSQTCFFTYPIVAGIVKHLDPETNKNFRLTMKK
ncbi:hypothetical protein B9Z65_7212 [Elsinoe australis]|uniref:Uncharacterized protein n=1 Tax=Elsinoe australis TaxID=40998 RepID=A0A2P7Z656_9PEZI|nr:hypothetical protein B9Z65_7212 [Elsinoe australis]